MNQPNKSARTTLPMEPKSLMIRLRLGNGPLACQPHSFKAGVVREDFRDMVAEAAREDFRGMAVEADTTEDSPAEGLAVTTGLSGLIMEEEASVEVEVGALVVGLETIMEEEAADLTEDMEVEVVASAGTRL